MCAACSPRKGAAATVQENALREWQGLLEWDPGWALCPLRVQVLHEIGIEGGFFSARPRGSKARLLRVGHNHIMNTRLIISIALLVGFSSPVFSQNRSEGRGEGRGENRGEGRGEDGGEGRGESRGEGRGEGRGQSRGKSKEAVAKEVAKAVADSPGSAVEVVASFVEAYPEFAETIVKEAITAAKEADGNRATPVTVAAIVETVLRGSPKGSWSAVVQAAVAVAPDASPQIAAAVQSVAPGNASLVALATGGPLNQPGGGEATPGNQDPGSGNSDSSGGRPPAVNPPPIVDPPASTRANPGPPPFQP